MLQLASTAAKLGRSTAGKHLPTGSVVGVLHSLRPYATAFDDDPNQGAGGIRSAGAYPGRIKKQRQVAGQRMAGVKKKGLWGPPKGGSKEEFVGSNSRSKARGEKSTSLTASLTDSTFGMMFLSRRHWVFKVYTALTAMATPLIPPFYARRRQDQGLEDTEPERFQNRYGLTTVERPPADGKHPLLWVHGANVGEAVACIGLVKTLVNRYPDLHVLMTTNSVSSYNVLAPKLPDRTCIQYAPYDIPAYVKRFMDHWNPDAALLFEPDVTPNLLCTTIDRAVPVAVVNGRMSKRSMSLWQRWPLRSAVRGLLSEYEVILAASRKDLRRYIDLELTNSAYIGNLKLSAPNLPCDEVERDLLERKLKRRHVWLAASTHSGEEDMCANVHLELQKRHLANPLTIIAPRDPKRGKAIAKELTNKYHLWCARRSQREPIRDGVDVYIVDTLGELSLFYQLADATFVGGSLQPGIGGHNFIEAVRSGSIVLHGPHMANFKEIVDHLNFDSANRTLVVRDAADTTDVLYRFMTDEGARFSHYKNLRRAIDGMGGERLLQRYLEALKPVLEPLHCRTTLEDQAKKRREPDFTAPAGQAAPHKQDEWEAAMESNAFRSRTDRQEVMAQMMHRDYETDSEKTKEKSSSAT